MINFIFIFSIYSILGWIIEIIYFYFKTCKFQKRGAFNGPYCPLYGFSISITTLIIDLISKNYFVVFLISMLICTFFELITGILIEKTMSKKMWDYSDKQYNLKGYICLKFSLIWGVLATVAILFINPILLNQNIFSNNLKTLFAVTIIIFILFDAIICLSYRKND